MVRNDLQRSMGMVSNMSKQFYDNKAGVIDYFNIHENSQKFVSKKQLDLTTLSAKELFELHAENEIKFADLSELYQVLKDDITLGNLSRLSKFRTAVRIEMRKREMISYDEMLNKIKSLEAMVGK